MPWMSSSTIRALQRKEMVNFECWNSVGHATIYRKSRRKSRLREGGLVTNPKAIVQEAQPLFFHSKHISTFLGRSP